FRGRSATQAPAGWLLRREGNRRGCGPGKQTPAVNEEVPDNKSRLEYRASINALAFHRAAAHVSRIDCRRASCYPVRWAAPRGHELCSAVSGTDSRCYGGPLSNSPDGEAS